MRTLTRFAAGTAVVALLVAGCGGTDPEDGAAPAGSQAAATGDLQCQGTPREGVAVDPQAQACADNGFEFDADVFAFANWGGTGHLDATGLVAMFGPDAVCADQSNGSCTLFPAAKDWLAQVNEAMAGGRCEGMAVVAAQLEDGGEPVSMLQSGAQATVELLQETAPVVEQIEYWWATQMVPEVAGPTAQVRALQPSEVVATLIEGLRAGSGYTLGMYSNGAGHAVTPFAVSQSPDGSFDIAIYDNNDPTTIAHVFVDPVAQTWTYGQAAINPDEQSAAWTGSGPGTLDLTAMDWRAGPFQAPFADAEGDSAKGEAQRTFLVTAGLEPGEGSVGAQISAGGVRVDTSAALDEVLQLPSGVVVTPIKAQVRGQGTVVGIQVTAPARVGEITIAPLVRTKPNSAGRTRSIAARVSVDAPGQPRVTVVGRGTARQPAFVLTSAGDGSTGVQARRGSRVVASIASGRASIAIPLPAGAQLDIGDDANGAADILITDEAGDEATLVLDGETDGEILGLVALLEDGEWALEPSQDGDAQPWEDPSWFEDQPSDEQGEEPAADEPDADPEADPEADPASDSDGNQADDPTESNDADPVDSSDSSDSSGPGSDSGGGDSGGGDSGGGDSDG